VAAVRAIGDALEVPVDAVGNGRPADHAINLTDGSAGTALLFTYLARGSEREPALGDTARWLDAAAAHLDHAIVGANAIELTAGLSAGFTGVAWAISHVGRTLGLDVDIPASLDLAVRALVTAGRAPLGFDLISGAVGFGVYFLERLPEPGAADALVEIVDHLAACARHDGAGLAWPTPPELVPIARRSEFPSGYVDLGMAHGIAGVIAFLASTHDAGLAVARSRALLEGAVGWLLARPRTDGGFPWAHIAEVTAGPARLAWCYGDLGIALALLRAARTLDRPGWREHARALLVRSARRGRAETGVADACLCHGSAGVLHLFRRGSEMLPDPDLIEAAHAWAAATLAMRDDTVSSTLAGFAALAHEDGRAYRHAERGLLNGAAGIALALLPCVVALEPAWDRALLLSSRTPTNQPTGEKS
jgi:lantibiotic biosynthesis protein